MTKDLKNEFDSSHVRRIKRVLSNSRPSHGVTTLSWWAGLRVSVTPRAMSAGVQTKCDPSGPASRLGVGLGADNTLP